MMDAGTVHVAFGSNIDPASNLVRALDAIAGMTPVQAVSLVYAGAPVDAEGGEFLNAVAAVAWSCDLTALADLKDRLTEIEAAYGRTAATGRNENASRWAARTIDLDIVLAGRLTAEYGDRPWQVPHPDIIRFAHVAVPLADVAPGPHPVSGRALTDIATELQARTELRPVEVAGWRHP